MSKKLVESFIKLSDKIKTIIIKGNIDQPISGTKWEVKVEGEFKDVSNQTSLKSLEKLMLEGFNNINARLDRVDSRLDRVEQRLDKVEQRLDVLESDVKDLKSDMKEVKSRLDNIESCPTIQKELKSIN